MHVYLKSIFFIFYKR
uniref:Uncharacterized protein n=1 Tax=Anguilla anguilla TaxID=7936 RepID=A0A0E9V436_ANGAN